MTMYHYRESGLDNVWLVNGYKKHKTSAGPAVSFEDVDALLNGTRNLFQRQHIQPTGSQHQSQRHSGGQLADAN